MPTLLCMLVVFNDIFVIKLFSYELKKPSYFHFTDTGVYYPRLNIMVDTTHVLVQVSYINVCTFISPTIKDSILFSRILPVNVIGDIKVFIASFNSKYFRPLYKPCLLILAVKMIHRDGKLKKDSL